MKFLIRILISAFTIFLSAIIIPGIEVNGFGESIWVAILLAVLNATIGFILKILTLPINFLTLGLVGFLINVLMLRLADSLISGFSTSGFLASLFMALFIALANPILQRIFIKEKK